MCAARCLRHPPLHRRTEIDGVKSCSPFSTPGSWQRCCLQKGSEIDIAAVCEAYQKVAAVQPSSREDAGVIMGVTAEGTPIGLRVDPDEELEMEE